MHDATVAAHDERPSGEAAVVDIASEVPVDTSQAFGSETGLGRFDLDQHVGHVAPLASASPYDEPGLPTVRRPERDGPPGVGVS